VAPAALEASKASVTYLASEAWELLSLDEGLLTMFATAGDLMEAMQGHSLALWEV